MSIVQNMKKYDWATWLMGILRSLVSGGANSVIAGLTSMGVDPEHFNLNHGLSNTLKMMAAQFVLGAIVHMGIFLQTHGSPEANNGAS